MLMGLAPAEELPDPLTLVHAPRLAHPTEPPNQLRPSEGDRLTVAGDAANVQMENSQIPTKAASCLPLRVERAATRSAGVPSTMIRPRSWPAPGPRSSPAGSRRTPQVQQPAHDLGIQHITTALRLFHHKRAGYSQADRPTATTAPIL